MIKQCTFFYPNYGTGRKTTAAATKTDVSAKAIRREEKQVGRRRDQEADNKSVWNISRPLGFVMFFPQRAKGH